jgi:cellulose synthase/poly-beta-1,6-N-acetylglucosamine synthase-like glycosyltransferase
MIPDILSILNYLLAGSLILFMNIPVLLTFLSSFTKNNLFKPQQRPNFISCIITSHGDPSLCALLIESLLKSDYELFEILIVLDDTNHKLHHPDSKVIFLYPEEPLNSKLRSIHFACQFLHEESERILLFDSDNLAHPNLLKEIDNAFSSSFVAVQARRKAKNGNSPLAAADALGEAYYNFTDRYIPFKIGSSASISGSGICLDKNILMLFFDHINLHPIYPHLGEDKLIQNFIVGNQHRIAYAPKAIVYDEKVSQPQQLRRQRARWINTYFTNIPAATRLLFWGVLHHNWNSLIFGIITLRPPMFLNLGLIVLLALINLFVNPLISLALLTGVLIFLGFFIILTHSLGAFRYLKFLPVFIFNQFIALFHAPGYRKEFGKTPTTMNITIEEAIKNDILP